MTPSDNPQDVFLLLRTLRRSYCHPTRILLASYSGRALQYPKEHRRKPCKIPKRKEKSCRKTSGFPQAAFTTTGLTPRREVRKRPNREDRKMDGRKMPASRRPLRYISVPDFSVDSFASFMLLRKGFFETAAADAGPHARKVFQIVSNRATHAVFSRKSGVQSSQREYQTPPKRATAANRCQKSQFFETATGEGYAYATLDIVAAATENRRGEGCVPRTIAAGTATVSQIFRTCKGISYRIGWHVPELAKGVARRENTPFA